MQAHSAKATTNNQQEQEPKQATKQQTKQRLEIVRPAQSRSLFGRFGGGVVHPPPRFVEDKTGGTIV